jgi:hypothetical protein
MTSRTRYRKSCRNVVRIVSALKVNLVTGVAIGRRSLIHTTNVATRAGSCGVFAGQRECGLAVIEGRSGP